MKKIIFGFLLAFPSFTLFSQNNSTANEDFYLFDNDWKPTSKSQDAAYFARQMKLNDTTWKWELYNFLGPMVASLQFKDADHQQMHGDQMYYHSTGFPDSSGRVLNGRLDGEWSYMNDTGIVIMKKIYEKGELLSARIVTKDSIENKDSTQSDETESTFPGGVKQWQRFLLKNLTYPDRAIKAKIMGEVQVYFIIDSTGKVTDAGIWKSVEYSLDQETIRLIKKSPKWNPAWQKGRYVKSYKRQPLVFRF